MGRGEGAGRVSRRREEEEEVVEVREVIQVEVGMAVVVSIRSGGEESTGEVLLLAVVERRVV